MRKIRFNFQNFTSGLNSTFLKVVALSSVLPLVLSAFLLASNYNHERRKAEDANLYLKNLIHSEILQIIKDIKSNLTIASQNQDVIDVLRASDSVRPFIENRAYGRLSEVSDRSKVIHDWALWSAKSKKLIISSFKEGFPIEKIDTESEKEIFLVKDSIFLNVPIQMDDQNLHGPNSITEGRIFARIELQNFRDAIPKLIRINSIISREGSINLNLEIIENNPGTIYVVIVSISILSILMISITFGLYLFRRNFIIPLQNISNKLQNTHRGTEGNEFEKLQSAIESHIENLKTQESERSEKEKLVAANMIASQVAHDIRSPLTALNMVIGTIDKLPEDKRILIRNAIQRINDIANDLLSKGKMAQSTLAAFDKIDLKTDSEAPSIVMLSSLIDILVSEKRTQYRDKIGIQIGADLSQSYGLFAKLPANELKRVLSNLVNNSVEAFENTNGKIFIKIKEENNWIKIEVIDNGKGIPNHILEKLGTPGVSFGKQGTSSGSGLGIQHAFKFITAIGGKIGIESDSLNSKGTTVTLLVPKSQPPVWFVSKIEISENGRVIALDDDQSIHSVWQGRLSSLKAKENKIQLTSFTSADVFKNWVVSQENSMRNSIYLIDYELLGQKIIGLDIIEELNLQKYSILVSSRYDEKNVYERCKRLGVRIIPKAMAGLVPIEIAKAKTQFDAVLIDDDELVHMTWNISAKENHKNILVFKTEEEFIKKLDSIDPITPVVIDYHLENGLQGDEIARKLYEAGFNNIYIGTGLNPSQFSEISWIKGVLGKAPDWNTLSNLKV